MDGNWNNPWRVGPRELKASKWPHDDGFREWKSEVLFPFAIIVPFVYHKLGRTG